MKRMEPNQKYGNLTVIRRDLSKQSKKPYWLCLCQCGKEKSVRADYLVAEQIVSCGCYRTSKFAFSPENIRRCEQLFKEGKGVEEIAQSMRVSPNNVCRFLKGAGSNPAPLTRANLLAYRQQDKLRWVKKYFDWGMSLAEIASAENTTTATISKTFANMGLPTRERGSQSPSQISRFKAKALEYWGLYEGGMSLAEIAETFGASSPAVFYILKAHGYTLRTRSEASRKKRILHRKSVRQLIGARGIKLSETKKAGKLKSALITKNMEWDGKW
jgi:predicted DNA-binding protein YlxM (UPF0122 family)